MRLESYKPFFLLAALMLAFFGGAVKTYAQSTDPSGRTRAITTAVPFLLICPDSRHGGMAETGTAIAEGPNGLFWNPAALTQDTRKFGFAVNYSPWLYRIVPDINLFYVPAYYNFGERGGVAGAALTFFSLGNIEYTNQDGIKTGEFNASEFAFSTHYSHLITKTLSAGVGLRYIFSSLIGASAGQPNTKPGQSFAGDIYVHWDKPFRVQGRDLRLRIGGTITNLGAKMNYTQSSSRDFIPTNLRLGWGLTYAFDEYNSITFTNDFSKLMVPSAGGNKQVPYLTGVFESFGDAPDGFAEELREIIPSVGAEYWYNNLFSARMGMFYEASDKGNRQFMTLGAGIRFRVFTLDAAYLVPFTQRHPLEHTLRFSLSFQFGDVNDTPRRR
jgi:hypothetical protein